MNFGFEEHQHQLVRSATGWAERRWAAADTSSVDVRRTLWGELVENGWGSLLAADGEAGSVLDAALLVEALGRGGCSLPLGPATTLPMLLAATDREPAETLDESQAWVLSGPHSNTKTTPSRGLELADRAVAVRVEDPQRPGRELRWTIGVVPLDGEQGRLLVQDESPVLLSSPVLDDVAWQPANPTEMERIWLIGAILSAAELVGIGQAALDACVDYAKLRVQGGKPIGAHQAIQHRLADMLGYVERTRYLTYAAAAAEAPDQEGKTLDFAAAHQAKALAGRDILTTIRSAHQVMGAIGFSAEHPLPHQHKHALVVAHEFGSAGWHWQALDHQPARL